MSALEQKQLRAFRSRKYPWDSAFANYGDDSFPMRFGQWWLIECRPIQKSGWRRLKLERRKPAKANHGRFSLNPVWNGERLAGGSESRDLDRYPSLKRALLAALRKYDSTARRKYQAEICRPVRSDHEGLW